MSQLRKTQVDLLKKAARNSYGVVSIHTGFYIGRRSPAYGSRAHNAAIALRDAGLLVFERRHTGVHHFIGGFASEHYSEHVFRITDAGRAQAV